MLEFYHQCALCSAFVVFFKMYMPDNWGPPPMCLESSAVMSFHFGVDKFQYCSWGVDTALYNRLKDVTQGHGMYH